MQPDCSMEWHASTLTPRYGRSRIRIADACCSSLPTTNGLRVSSGRRLTELEERRRHPAFLRSVQRVGLHIVEVQDRIGLVQLDLDRRAARNGPGDVQAFVTVIEKDRWFNHLSLVDACRPCGATAVRGWNAAGIRIRVIREGQVRYVGVMLECNFGCRGRWHWCRQASSR